MSFFCSFLDSHCVIIIFYVCAVVNAKSRMLAGQLTLAILLALTISQDEYLSSFVLTERKITPSDLDIFENTTQVKLLLRFIPFL